MRALHFDRTTDLMLFKTAEAESEVRRLQNQFIGHSDFISVTVPMQYFCGGSMFHV